MNILKGGKLRKMPDGGKIPKYVAPNNSAFNNTYPSFNNFFDEELLRQYNPDNTVRRFHTEYVNSPKYRERLEKMGYTNADDVIRDRGKRLQEVRILPQTKKEVGSAYYPSENTVFIDNKQVSKLKTTRDDILAHELGHAINSSINVSLDPNYNVIESISNTSLNKQEEDYISSRNKKLHPGVRYGAKGVASKENKSLGHILERLDHDYSPSENKSDIDSFRYMLKQEGIHDAGKEDFTPEMLKEAKENKNIRKIYNPKRLFENFSDEGLIEIMNTVAYNKNNEMKTIAKYGGKLRKLPDGGRLNSDYEKARAARLLELSKQWGVPTDKIFSKVKMGPRDAYRLNDAGQRTQNPEYTSYYTFNPEGGIGQSTRDYANPVGQTQFTAEDIQLQQEMPGTGITVDQVIASNTPVKPKLKKMAIGGPGPRAVNWDQILANNPGMGDAIFPATSTTPPGVNGTSIALGAGENWTPTSTPAALTSTRSSINWSNAGNTLNSIAPYASNIVNAFRKPPMPSRPIMDAPPVLQQVSYDNDRYEINRAVGAADIAADRSVDGQTASRLRSFNLSKRLDALSRVNQAERNQNIGISNQQAMLNAQVGASNTAKTEGYNESLVARRIAQQREASANISNAADKFVMIGNEKRKAQTDRDKATILRSLYDKSGVMQRQGKQWKSQGIEDPFGENYSWLKD